MTTQHETYSIVFETSPYGNLDAVVEHDGRAVYFYLSASQNAGGQKNTRGQSSPGGDRFGMRACWVRNLQPGPHVISTDDMQAGIAPMLPRYDCVDPTLIRLPTAESLEIVWLDEGNGAALYEISANESDGTQSPVANSDTPSTARELIAVIPPWSGLDGFHGYAANCGNQSQVCWPLPDNPLLIQRIEKARNFWNAWSSEAAGPDGTMVSTSPFALAQPAILENYAQRLGSTEATEKYYAIDGGKFPQRGLIHHQVDRPHGGLDVLATIGMSVCPQPAVEMFSDQPAKLRRIEIALIVNQTGDAKLLNSLMQQMSGLSAYPWSHFTWLGAGHTVSLSCGQFTAALLIDDAHGSQIVGADTVALPDFYGDPVSLLWLLPITSDQQKDLECGALNANQVVDQWVQGDR